MCTKTDDLAHCAWLRRELLAESGLREYFEAVWDEVLVPLAGASRHPFDRVDFIEGHLSRTDPAEQWRFQGLFGFGGKVITASDLHCRVSYYPEDRTAPREQAQELVNLALAELHRLHLQQPK